jgi:arylsulfatase A-like enzyme
VRQQRERLLAEVLRRCGYTTRGVTTNVWAGKASGFDTGFDEFVELDTSRHNALGGSLRERLKWDLAGMRNHADDGAAQAESVIDGWVSRDRAEPFFLFVNLVECHSPYLPPRPYDRASALTRLLAAEDAQRYLTLEAIMRACLGVDRVPDSALKRMRLLYAASLRYVDDWTQRLVDRLAAAGSLEDTLIIVCSDHGENFGEGGLISHGLSLDERLLRVPLIVAGPQAAGFTGMRSLAELPSRIAAAVGLEEHPWGDGLVRGLPVAQWDPFSLSEAELDELAARLGLDQVRIDRLMSPLTAVVSGRFKLLRGTGPRDERLYDLAADPGERAPIVDDEQMEERAGETLELLRAALHHPSVHARPAVTATPDQVSADEAADIERKMKLLGYM